MGSVYKTKEQKISDLLACYYELTSGESVEHFFKKYIKADVLVSLELFSKGITPRQLTEFIRKRDAHIKAMLNGCKWFVDEKGKVVVT